MSARPLIINVAPVVSTLLGLYTAAFLFLVITSGTGGSFGIGGATVGRAEFLLRVIPFLALDVLGSLALAYGFVRERSWARTLCVVYPVAFSLFGLLTTPGQDWLATIPGTIVVAALSLPLYWYFYRGPRMRAYYASLAGEIAA